MTCVPGAVRFTRAEMFAGDDRGVHHGDADALPLLWFDSPPATPSPQMFSRCGNLETNPMNEFVHLERAAAIARDRCVRDGDPLAFSRHYREACSGLGVDPDARPRIGPEVFGRQFAERRVPKPVTTQIPAGVAAVRDRLIAEGSSDRETVAVRFARGLDSLRR